MKLLSACHSKQVQGLREFPDSRQMVRTVFPDMTYVYLWVTGIEGIMTVQQLCPSAVHQLLQLSILH